MKRISKRKNRKTKQSSNNLYTHDDAYKTLEIINLWINNCDTKASIILSGMGVVATIIFSSDYTRVIKKILETAFLNFFSNEALCIFFIIALALVFIGLVFFVLTITPRIIINTEKSKCLIDLFQKWEKERNNKNLQKASDNAQQSIMFYGIIALKEYSNYVKEVETKADEFDETMKDLVFQIHSAATICNSKFKKFQKGMIFCTLGIALMAICLIFGYYKLY